MYVLCRAYTHLPVPSFFVHTLMHFLLPNIFSWLALKSQLLSFPLALLDISYVSSSGPFAGATTRMRMWLKSVIMFTPVCRCRLCRLSFSLSVYVTMTTLLLGQWRTYIVLVLYFLIYEQSQSRPSIPYACLRTKRKSKNLVLKDASHWDLRHFSCSFFTRFTPKTLYQVCILCTLLTYSV